MSHEFFIIKTSFWPDPDDPV